MIFFPLLLSIICFLLLTSHQSYQYMFNRLFENHFFLYNVWIHAEKWKKWEIKTKQIESKRITQRFIICSNQFQHICRWRMPPFDQWEKWMKWRALSILDQRSLCFHGWCEWFAVWGRRSIEVDFVGQSNQTIRFIMGQHTYLKPDVTPPDEYFFRLNLIRLSLQELYLWTLPASLWVPFLSTIRSPNWEQQTEVIISTETFHILFLNFILIYT